MVKSYIISCVLSNTVIYKIPIHSTTFTPGIKEVAESPEVVYYVDEYPILLVGKSIFLLLKTRRFKSVEIETRVLLHSFSECLRFIFLICRLNHGGEVDSCHMKMTR